MATSFRNAFIWGNLNTCLITHKAKINILARQVLHNETAMVIDKYQRSSGSKVNHFELLRDNLNIFSQKPMC